MNKIFKSVLLVFLATSLSSCDMSTWVYDGNIRVKETNKKVRIKDFPPVKDVSDLDVYRYAYSDNVTQMEDAKENGFKPLIWHDVEKYKYPTPAQIQSQKQSLLPKSGCVLDVDYETKSSFNPDGIFGKSYGVLSFATLGIIPYYRPGTHAIVGTLIDAKTGNILKKYRFEERSDYLATTPNLPFLIIMAIITESDPSGNNFRYKLDKALVSTVTNDAHTLPECQKQPQSKANSAAKK